MKEQVIELAKQADKLTQKELKCVGYHIRWKEVRDQHFATLVREQYRAELLTGSPEPDTHCFDTDTNTDVWSHSKDQLAAAVLRARREALEALEIARDHIDMAALEISHSKDAEIIRAAIRNLKEPK